MCKQSETDGDNLFKHFTTPGVRSLPAVAGLGAARGAEQAAGAAPAALLPRAARATRAPCTGTRGRTQPVLALGSCSIQSS